MDSEKRQKEIEKGKLTKEEIERGFMSKVNIFREIENLDKTF